jgi:glycosyltransferase involved in cell wall biosynthesis
VLFVHSSADRYGADRQLEVMCRTLDATRVTPLALLPYEGPLSADLRALGVEVLTGPLAVLRSELLSAAGLRRLAGDVRVMQPALEQLVRAQGIDIVHANTSAVLGLRRPAAAAGARLVTHVREIYPEIPVAWPLHRRALLRSDRVVCVSRAVRAALGTEAAHVRVIHDGLGVPSERAPREAARLALGLPRDAFVVAVLGRITTWKGQEVLARALAEPALADAIGIVAGAVWPGQEQHETALRDAAGERFRLLGWRDDVATVYGAADVVVVPSTRPDPLPNTALEAGAAGCCVVAANHGGLPEIIKDGVTGRLVAPGDHRGLATTLAALAADPAERERLGAAAARDIRARFAPALLGERIAGLYAEIVRADDHKSSSGAL